MRRYIPGLVACLFWFATGLLDAKIVWHSGRFGEPQIYIMNSDGSNPRQVGKDPGAAGWPILSPNGRQIVYHSNRGSQVVFNDNIWVMDVDGKNPRQLTQHPKHDNYPDWSPDGRQIVFDSDRGKDKNGWPTTEIYVIDADGGNLKQVTDLGFASRPRCSPDGQWILFEGIVEEEPGRHIFAIRPDGTDMWMLSEPRPGTGMYLGGWSPDAKRVVYAAAVRGQVTEVTLIIATLDKNRRPKVIKREEIPLPHIPALATVSFGADGKSVLFSGQFWGMWNIFRFRLDTHELIQLTDEFHYDAGPQEWNPRLSVVTSQERLIPQHWGKIKSVFQIK